MPQAQQPQAFPTPKDTGLLFSVPSIGEEVTGGGRLICLGADVEDRPRPCGPGREMTVWGSGKGNGVLDGRQILGGKSRQGIRVGGHSLEEVELGFSLTLESGWGRSESVLGPGPSLPQSWKLAKAG